jgi:hypothetical protein
MMTRTISPAELTNQELLEDIKRLAAREREATAALIGALIELDTRKLYLGEGCSSLFTYCTQVLHLSEHAAYGRIEAARTARRFPLVLELLSEGAVTLTTVGLLSPILTAENHRAVLASTHHKSKREVEHIVAALRPQPPVPTIVRKLPERQAPATPISHNVARDRHTTAGAGGSQPAALAPTPLHARPAEVKPLAPERYKVQFTVTRQTHDKLRRVQDLMRHQVPNGDPAAIFDKALTLLLEQLERKTCGTADRPRAACDLTLGSRHVPAAVRRAVWTRDAGRCAFVGATGRCLETGFLELHHLIPFAVGGRTTVENIQLRCRAHNAYEAETYLGCRQLRTMCGAELPFTSG